MIAGSQSTSSSLCGYISIGKAAAHLGVAVQSLRAWEAQGLIKAYRTPGGHGQRRYLLSELKAQVLGIEDQEVPEGKKICIYVRVSSAAQQREGNLDRQLSRMLETVSEREGIDKDQIQIFKDTASAFGQREGLNSMVDELIGGRIAKIYIEHQDRLSRVPALTRLLEHLAKRSGVQLVALDREESVDEMKNAMLELVEFCTVLANRTNARKQAERRRKVLSPTTLDFIRKEIAGGRSIRETVRRANDLGYRTEKGDPISYRVVQKYLSKVVDKLLPVEARNTFAEFVGKHLRRKMGSNVQSAAIHNAYKAWCRKNKIEPLNWRKCGDWLAANGYKYIHHGNYCWQQNVEIIGFASIVPDQSNKLGTWGRLFDNGIRGERLKYLKK